MDIFADDVIIEKIESINKRIKLTKDKEKIKESKERENKLKEKLAGVTRKLYLLDSIYNPEQIIKCDKCNMKLKEKNAAYGYNEFFCVDCYLEVEKQAKQEAGKIFKDL